LGKEKCIWELTHSIRILGEKNLISGVKYYNFKVEAGGMYLYEDVRRIRKEGKGEICLPLRQ
jgi:hypothetical protein